MYLAFTLFERSLTALCRLKAHKRVGDMQKRTGFPEINRASHAMRRNSRDVTSPRPSKYNNKNIKTRNLTASGPFFFALSDVNAATRRAARSGIRWRLFLRFASTACRGDDVEALPQRDGGAGLVHGVEMQARRASLL